MRAKFVNERLGFTEDGDPIKDMGIGQKEAIRYSIQQMYVLDDANKYLLRGDFYLFYFSQQSIVSFLLKKGLTGDYKYFENLAEKSGLSSYLYMHDNNANSLPGADEVSWTIKPKHVSYFEELENE